MKKINLQCKSSSHMHSNAHIKLNIAVLILVYIGKALTQIWMKYTNKWVSYEANICMLNKSNVNFTRNLYPGGLHKLCAHKKSVRWKSKETKKQRKIKNDGCFIQIDQRDVSVIRNYWIKTKGSASSDSILIERTINVLNIRTREMGMVFWMWEHKRAP